MQTLLLFSFERAGVQLFYMVDSISCHHDFVTCNHMDVDALLR